MVEAATTIVDLIDGRPVAELADDRVSRDAILWNFTVLGEAAAQLPDDFKATHVPIPWAKASRLRNRIVHGYWNISAQIVHDTAEVDLPPLITALKAVLEGLETSRPTNEQIQAWADEAELGYDVEELASRESSIRSQSERRREAALIGCFADPRSAEVDSSPRRGVPPRTPERRSPRLPGGTAARAYRRLRR